MEKNKRTDLSVVIPLYNEEEVLGDLLNRVSATVRAMNVSYEIIFVNDGSSDGTLQKLKNACKNAEHVKYISFSRNFGHQVAILAGMEHSCGDAIITIDGDLQDPPELMAEMYREFLNGSKVIYARRLRRHGEPLFKKSATYVFYRLLARIVPFDIPLDVGDYRLIGRNVLEYVLQMDEYDKYLRGQIAWLGFKSAYVYYNRDGRKYGESHYPFSKLLKLAFNGITSFSDKPLKLATKSGFAVCFISVLLGIYALYSYYIKQVSPPGWASLMITITFLGGVQLLSLGILGEYISRINNNVRKRPLYVIEQSTIGEDLSTHV